MKKKKYSDVDLKNLGIQTHVNNNKKNELADTLKGHSFEL